MNSSYAAWLSLRAIRHRPLPTLVSALGLAAVLAPLIILYGLKSGVITGLIETLKSDPTILQVALTGNNSLTDEEVAALRQRPEVAVALGTFGKLSGRTELGSAALGMGVEISDWQPAAENDPLLPAGTTIGEDEIALAEPLAERLRVVPGQPVQAFAYRNNAAEVLAITLTVAEIVPRRKLDGREDTLALVHPSVLDRRAAFQDDFEVPEYGIGGRPLAERNRAYSSVRLYASSIEDVVALDGIMSAAGFRPDSKAANIAWVQSLEMVMAGVFGVISTAGVIGFSLSLWANVTSNLQQYRGQLSLLRLLGLGSGALTAFPAVQVLATATLGVLLATALAIGAATLLNRLFLTDMFDGSICRIEWGHLALGALVSYAISLVVMLWLIHRLSAINPSEALAENV